MVRETLPEIPLTLAGKSLIRRIGPIRRIRPIYCPSTFWW